MRQMIKWLVATGFLSLAIMAGTGGMALAAAMATGPGRVMEEVATDGGIEQMLTQIPKVKDSDQLILVVGGEGFEARISYYKQDEMNNWSNVFTTDGTYGRNGSTSEKKEGDGKTPTGFYRFTLAFGNKPDPGSVMDYHEVQSGDYWIDDPDSQYYNRLINAKTIPDGWKSGEKLENYVPDYNYALALNYNEDCIPGDGSAIFLHCKMSAARGSSGCICIPEDLMKTVVSSVTENSGILIVSSLEELHQMVQ